MSIGSMTLRFASLPHGHSVHQASLEFVLLDAAEQEEPYTVGVTADVDVLGPRVHVRGAVAGTARAACHRCLGPFDRPVTAEFEITLQRGQKGEPDENFVSISDNEVEYDLAPHVREAVLLEEPIQLLCGPDCRGLCAQCGADLNQGPCGCTPHVDPRWAPLEDLRRRT